MIVLGVVALIIGLLLGNSLIMNLGVLFLVLGLILLVLGYAGRPLGGRGHWW